MDEKLFYESIEKGMQVSPDATDGYIPTVEEMIEKGADKEPEKYLPLLTYVASDPLRRGNEAYTNEYRKSVEYAKKLLLEIPLVG